MRLRGEVPERFSWHRDKLCPGAEKALSQRREKVTFIIIEEKSVGFPGAERNCVPAPGKLCPGKLCFDARESCVPAPGKLFPGALESCVPAPGKLFPGAGKMLGGRRLV